MVGVAEKTIDVSGGLYRDNASFAEWLQYHFFPQTKEYGVMTSESAACITDSVIAWQEDLAGKWKCPSSHLVYIGYELLAVPDDYRRIFSYEVKQRIPSVLPVIRANNVWEMQDAYKKRYNPGSRVSIVSIAEEGEIPQFKFKYGELSLRKLANFNVGDKKIDFYVASPTITIWFEYAQQLDSGEEDIVNRIIIYKKESPEKVLAGIPD